MNEVMHVSVKGEEFTPDTHETMTKRRVAKLVASPCAMAKEHAEFSSNSPRLITRIEPHRIDKLSAQDSARLRVRE
jgi:hypothetical protein